MFDLERVNRSRLYRALGIRLTAAQADSAASEMRATDPVCWPGEDQPHGGIVFTQLDTTMATAALGGDDNIANATTVSLQIQYLAPARGEVLYCEATVQRRGGRLCFVQGETRDPDGQLVAVGQGSFRIFAPTA
ncbi:MAG: PaaI family thioesterase [Pseudomonadota bacterium]